MHRGCLLVAMALLLSAASVATPYAEQLPAGQSPGNLVSNPYCLVGGCGYGRDGIPAPYAGGGLAGRSARAYSRSADPVFGAKRTNLLSWVSSADMIGTPTNANDIWGYTSPSGREYAIVGLKTGTAFVEITDPVNPQFVRLVRGAVSDWRDMAVYRSYAYSINETNDGIQVIDLTQIDDGIVSLSRTVKDAGLYRAHNIFVNEDSGYAYVLGSNIARGGLLAADLSDPANPVLEPINWEVAYVHDVIVTTYKRGRNKGREIAFAFTGRFGLHIIDVTDPITLANLRYDNATYGHSGSLSANGRFLYVNDELDERANSDVDRMTTYIVRVGDLENPVLIDTIAWDARTIDHNSMIQDGRMYMSAYQGGLRVIDVEDPRRPKAYGYFDTHPEGETATFTGAWGIYAGFPSGNVIVSDIERGLFVIRAR
ncbi:MAG TPA: choice-of-anchor B family protein [Acidobacteriota bacterium]|nr:choice-of-anchor B family protein [Acidobacteriota bacterium]